MRTLCVGMVVALAAACAGTPARHVFLNKPLPPLAPPPAPPGPVYESDRVPAPEPGKIAAALGEALPSFECGLNGGAVRTSGAGSRGETEFMGGADFGFHWRTGFGLDGWFRTLRAEVRTKETRPSMFPPDDLFCMDFPDAPECQGQVLRCTDAGRFYFAGIKLSYSLFPTADSPLSWYLGAGPGLFRTSGFGSDDSGFGLLGEAGLSYHLTDGVALRLGVEGGGLRTDVDGDDDWLKFYGVILGLRLNR